MRRSYSSAWVRLAVLASGTLFIPTCGITDIALRDFALSTTTRVFFSTLGTAIQAAIVGQANS